MPIRHLGRKPSTSSVLVEAMLWLAFYPVSLTMFCHCAWIFLGVLVLESSDSFILLKEWNYALMAWTSLILLWDFVWFLYNDCLLHLLFSQQLPQITNCVAQTAALERCSHCPLPVHKEVLVGCSGTVPVLCLTGDWLMRKAALCLKDKSQQIASRWY